MSILYPTDDEYARERKLPSWAQDIITSLRGRANAEGAEVARLHDIVARLEGEIADAATEDTGPEDSTAWLWRETGGEELPALGLGKDAQVNFTPTDSIEITVQTEDNGIVVDSMLHLMVIPIERTRFLIQPVSAKIKN